MSKPTAALRRLAAFTDDPAGGNPAGVWITDELPSDDEMQRIATEVGYSETAFLTAVDERRYRIRYFSPLAEVSFCGHATIAAGVSLGDAAGEGTYRLETSVGEVPVLVTVQDGRTTAALTSVTPTHKPVSPDLLAEVMAAMGIAPEQLDAQIPPVLAWAGAWHLILSVSERGTLAAMDYHFERLKAAMQEANLTTVQYIHRDATGLFHARNPFPVGGVVEDPATGAAAAALGGYLRDAGLISAPTTFRIHQGDDMGRPSRLDVAVPVVGGITVSGGAVAI